MSDHQDDQPLSDHEYDGIQELNHPAPFWWQLFFYISIAFAIAYYAYYEIGPGISSDQMLQENLAEIQHLQNANRPALPPEKELLAMLSDSKTITGGKTVFLAKCSACHASDGGGLIGPNLTDSHWINGKGSILDIFKVIDAGVPDKGMPAWRPLLSKDELTAVVVFVKSLKGTKPATPKAPQGEKGE